MDTKALDPVEDAEMADGEKVVTMMDVLQEQQEFEEDANAVLGASDDQECTYSKGYIKRQAIYACLTCCADAKTDETKRAGVCLACSLNCHENHELIELYTKRNFRCDCGNPKFDSHPCQFIPNKTDLNIDNNYNQNFSGVYCICHRPYPDPDSTVEDEMIQCIICEDWLHASHLDAIVPPSHLYSEMICKLCMDKNEFLHDYSGIAVNVDNVDVDVTNITNEVSTIQTDTDSKGNEIGIIEENKDDNKDTETKQTKDDKQSQDGDTLNTADTTEPEAKTANGTEAPEVKENMEDNKQESNGLEPETKLTENMDDENIDEKVPASPKPENESLESQSEVTAEKTENDSSKIDTLHKDAEKSEITTESTEKISDQQINEKPIDNEVSKTVESITDNKSTEVTSQSDDQIKENMESLENTSHTDTAKSVPENTTEKCNGNASSEGDSLDKSNNFTIDIKNNESLEAKEKIDDSIESDIKIVKINGTEKRKISTEADETCIKKAKLDETKCIRPKGVKKIYKGATFWPSVFRQKLCTCNECLAMYKDLDVLFLLDPEDTVTAYETLGKEKIDGEPTTQYEKGLQALSSLDRIQQINALTEYNKMRDKLLDFLKSFKDRKEVVKEEDIKAFFAGMKPKREPDGVYFCR